VPPATIAEWTLSGDDGSDNYDVSLVDGYNLPMSITNNKGCPVADCPVDLGPSCPSPLKGPYDSSGFPVGCKSACVANLSGDPTNSPNCCSGSYDTPATCPSSSVAYYSYFKSNWPNTYAYAYDVHHYFPPVLRALIYASRNPLIPPSLPVQLPSLQTTR
jgi:hypothetical protein